MLKFQSKINYANPNSKSLKVGVPKKVAESLNVKAGDTMEWILDVENNEMRMYVKKAEG